jgi:hypothetical protein
MKLNASLRFVIIAYPTDNPFLSHSFYLQVDWMKNNPPGGDNDIVIEEYMKETFGYRQKQIKNSLTEPGLAMKEYPRFKEFQKWFSGEKKLYRFYLYEMRWFS